MPTNSVRRTRDDSGWTERLLSANDHIKHEKEKNMKRLLAFTVAVLAVGVSGARAQDVKYNFAKDAKFSDYKTFKWVDAVKGSDQVDQITDNNLRQALEAELAKKGLTKTDSDDADLYIGYQTAIGTE